MYKFILLLVSWLIINNFTFSQENKNEIMDKLVAEAKSGLSEDQKKTGSDSQMDSIELLKQEAVKDKKLFPDLRILLSPGLVYYSDAIGYSINADILFHIRAITTLVPNGLVIGLDFNTGGAFKTNSGISLFKMGFITGYQIPLNISKFKFIITPSLVTGFGIYNINLLNDNVFRTAFVLIPKLSFTYEIFKYFEVGLDTGFEMSFGVYSRPVITAISTININYGFNIIK